VCLIQKTTITFKRCLFSPRWIHFKAIFFTSWDSEILFLGMNYFSLNQMCRFSSLFPLAVWGRIIEAGVNHQDTAETNLNNRFDDFSKREKLQRNFFYWFWFIFHLLECSVRFKSNDEMQNRLERTLLSKLPIVDQFSPRHKRCEMTVTNRNVWKKFAQKAKKC
jgi:hypothetical protein